MVQQLICSVFYNSHVMKLDNNKTNRSFVLNCANVGHKIRMIIALPHDNPERFIKHKSSNLLSGQCFRFGHYDYSFILYFHSSFIDIKFDDLEDLIKNIAQTFYLPKRLQRVQLRFDDG